MKPSRRSLGPVVAMMTTFVLSSLLVAAPAPAQVSTASEGAYADGESEVSAPDDGEGQITEIGACGSSHPAGTGWVCHDVTASASDTQMYSWHRTNTLVYGIGNTRVGSFQHGRDLNFNGRQGQFWQTGRWRDGPALRYDFRINIYRGTGHGTRADNWSDVEPEAPAFSTGYVVSPTWFVYHHYNQYHAQYRVHFRAQGVNNPSTSDGTFRSTVTATPYYYCGTGNCHMDAF